MLVTETRPPPFSTSAEPAPSGYEDRAWTDEPDRDGAPLLRLFGAAALAILALAAASLLV
ncbi:MAG: hypothetical protein V4792_01280 [Pseudomonadota bacterium]